MGVVAFKMQTPVTANRDVKAQAATDGAVQESPSVRRARIAGTLELFDWFRGVDMEQRLRLADVAEERTYEKGGAIVSQGDPGDGFYIIVSGSVNVVGSVENRSQGGFTETIFATLPEGQAFGEMALLDGGARSATIVARVPTTCLFVPRDAFIDTLRSSPATALAIMAALSGRMRHADDRLSEVLQITEALTSELDLEKVYEATVKVVQETTEAGRVSLQVLDESEDNLSLVAGYGLPPGAVVGQTSSAQKGLAGWVLRELRPLILTGTSHPDPEIDRLMHDIPGMTAVCVPMLLKGQPVGVLNASSVPSGTESSDQSPAPVGKALTQDELTFVTVLAGQVAIAIEQARLYEQTRLEATTDGMTGLINHRAFQESLGAEVQRAERAQSAELALLFVDVDSFKVINDTHGHPAGDQLLRVLTNEVLKPSLRQYDVLARYGGDEFAVILPNTGLEESHMVAERLRAGVEDVDYASHELPAETGKIVSFSIGLAHYPTDAKDRKALLDVADRGVYFAKFLGKNQVQRGRAAGPAGTDDPTSLHEFLVGADRDSLEALAAAIDARDQFTTGHSRRVAMYVDWLARALGHDEQFRDRLRLTALFHDVGKSAVPDGILRKAGRLTDQEFERMKDHPVVGAEMLDQVPNLEDAVPAARSHHERWDGSGYPDGLAGEEIPYTARLMAIADSYDAMTSDRLYRGALIFADIKRMYESGAGIQWEPELVKVWCDVLNRRSENGATPSADDDP